jgi:hypothetical protein
MPLRRCQDRFGDGGGTYTVPFFELTVDFEEYINRNKFGQSHSKDGAREEVAT